MAPDGSRSTGRRRYAASLSTNASVPPVMT
jgi:hypothetical protein